MAIKIGQEFERTSKATRFKDDVMSKTEMLACTDDNYSDGYLVVEKDSHDLYIYDSNATPSQETGKFVKSSGSGGYVLPTASASTLGGVKVGDNLNIDQDGVLSVDKNALPMTTDLLWELPSGSIVNPDTITLLNPTTDYDQILVVGYVHSNGKDHLMTSLLLPENLTTTNDIGLSDQEMRYIWYDVTSTTQLTKRIGDGGLLMFRIYGIRFGSSLDGTIGRWEKIGEWKPNGPRSMVIPNLTEYNAFAVSSIVDTTLDRNDNTAMVTLAEWEVGTFVQSTTLSGQYFQVHRDNETTIRFEGTLYGNVYGYKETAISDADVQKIADATALKSTNMEALWNNGELKGMKLFKNDNDLRIFDDGQVLLIDGNTTTRVNLTTKNYVDTEVAKKQDTLTAGTNITIDANNVISASGGGSLPAGGTTGQALVKKSNTSGDVERRTVQGLSNIVDMSFTQRSEEGETWTDSVTIKKGNSNNSYLEIKQNTENGNLLDVYITDNTVDVPHTLVSKYYADYNAGKIATIKVNGTEQTVANRTVDIKTPEFNVNVNGGEVNEATIVNKANGQVKEIISFSKSLVDENCIQFHTENDNMSDTPLDTHLTSKTYVDSKSPTIVNEGATFTNAQGNQKMQIRTGGTNSVIIKDTNASGTAEYWSYELPDKPYVDTEVAKRNAVVNFDNEYKTLQIRDVDNKLDFQVVKETSNDYVRMNEYAKDDRGQMQQIFDVNLPTKTYVDTTILSQEKTIDNDYYYTSREPSGYKLFKKNQTSNASTASTFTSSNITLHHNSGSGFDVQDLSIATQENGTCSVQMSDNMISAFNSALGAGINMKIDAEKWYGTYTDENNVTYQVYTKTIYIPALPATAGITTYQHGISGIKQILSAYGFTTDGFVLNAPRQTTSDNIAIYQVQKSATGGIAIEVGKDRSSKSAYVTLIYAKNN